MRTLTITISLALTASLGAAEPHRIAARTPLHLTALFERASDVVVTGSGMVVTEFEAPEVLVARIGADGRPVIGCVDNEKSARLFFTAAGKPSSEKAKQ